MTPTRDSSGVEFKEARVGEINISLRPGNGIEYFPTTLVKLLEELSKYPEIYRWDVKVIPSKYNT